MCTVILSIEPGALLLAGFRDELADRAWQPPSRHWPDYPELTGGRDLLAGGTWLAVAPAARRVACVLNGRGRKAAVGSRRSRGVLPLSLAADGQPQFGGLADFDPFHLLLAEPGTAVLWSWDGERLSRRELADGLHMILNSGLSGLSGLGGGLRGGGLRGGGLRGGGLREHEAARAGHFLPRLQAAARPVPRPGGPVGQAWGAWLPLLNGDGIGPGDERALIVRRDLGGGQAWGTTSVSLVALSPAGVRYDFTAAPGDPSAWYPVPLG